MPLVRTLIKIGRSSRAVVLPKSWLEYYEEKAGCKIEEVTIEVDGELRIKPIIQPLARPERRRAVDVPISSVERGENRQQADAE